MDPPRVLLVLFVFPAVLVMGCSSAGTSSPRAPDRAAMERALPQGVAMSDFVEMGANGRRVTVGDKLAEIKAVVGQDGKLYDDAGKPIEFYREQVFGMDPGPDYYRRQQELLDKMKERARVIEMAWDPDIAPPP
jgi:hypothetical protein